MSIEHLKDKLAVRRLQLGIPECVAEHSAKPESNGLGPLVAAYMKKIMAKQEIEARYADADRKTQGVKLAVDAGFPQRAVHFAATGPTWPIPTLIDDMVNILADGGVLVLIGDRGPGKTVACVCAGMRLCYAGARVRYAKTADYISELRHTTWTAKTMSESEWLKDQAEKVDALFLDEFQERVESDDEARLLTRIIDHRYDAMKATCIVSNLIPDAFEKSLPRSVSDRFAETATRIVFDWPSFRSANP